MELNTEKYFNRLVALVKGGMPLYKAYSESGKYREWFSKHLTWEQKRFIKGLKVPSTVVTKEVRFSVEETLLERFDKAIGDKTRKEVLVAYLERFVEKSEMGKNGDVN